MQLVKMHKRLMDDRRCSRQREALQWSEMLETCQRGRLADLCSFNQKQPLELKSGAT